MTFDQLTLFSASVIRRMGMTPTPGRLEYFAEWARWEGTDARFNPLATTQDDGDGLNEPGEAFNTFGDSGQYHVRNYSSFEEGVRATAETILNGYYNAIIRSIADEIAYPEAAAEVRTWGTTGFADNLAGGWKPGPWTAYDADADPGPVPEPAPDDVPPPLTIREIYNALDVIHAAVQTVARSLDDLNRAVIARDQRLVEAFDALAEGAVLASAKASEAATLELPAP